MSLFCILKVYASHSFSFPTTPLKAQWPKYFIFTTELININVVTHEIVDNSKNRYWTEYKTFLRLLKILESPLHSPLIAECHETFLTTGIETTSK